MTLRAVAREVGIATPSIYPHFPDQPAVLSAVVRAVAAELARQLRTAAGEDPRQRLYAAGQVYLDYATTHPRRYRAMLGATCGLVPRLFAGVLTDCVAAGYSTSTDPDADAVALWLGLHGLAHQSTLIHIYPWSADVVPRVVAALAHLNH